LGSRVCNLYTFEHSWRGFVPGPLEELTDPQLDFRATLLRGRGGKRMRGETERGKVKGNEGK